MKTENETKVKRKFVSLADERPDLAKEWNYEKNGDLKPEDVSYGSNKKVWWIYHYAVPDMYGMFYDCHSLTSLDLTPLDTSKVTDMTYMFAGCSGLTSLTTGTTFKFVGTDYELSGTWQNTAGETFTSGKFPSNVADTYTKIS